MPFRKPLHTDSSTTAMHFCFVLPSFTGGGAERVTLHLANGMRRKGHRTTVIVFNGTGPLRDLVDEEMPVIDLHKDRLRSAIWSLFATLRRERPDITFSSLGYVNVALLLARRFLPGRLVIREANLHALNDRMKGFDRLVYALSKWLYRDADLCIASSHTMEQALQAHHRVAPTKSTVIYNPVDIQTIRNSLEPQSTKADGIHIVAAGRLTAQKGFDRLLNAFADCAAGTHLTILGTGPEHDRLLNLATELGISDRVDFAGFVKQPWTILASADLFALPSRWEGMPNAALEALACGTPVLATHTSGAIHEVARLAEPDCVAVSKDWDEFVMRLKDWTKPTGTLPRDSLLPATFSLETAIARFEAETSTLVQA
ncbi:glycosyltransferase [Hwanghaeella grinnelliae]|uniref:Glycosyltransferase n=1 Tax=Hwanghaeella grinnelliae TaxID=2500179 RepID=A0A437QQE6_9PROT|nr:glycosyltransferase [Hwanghaeella grinnelliae]RVU36743.1 glycosyltransferase [Hwanghaeella grinnelliae]